MCFQISIAMFFLPRNFALDPQKPSPSGMGLGGILDREVPSYELDRQNETSLAIQYRDMMWGPLVISWLK